MKSWRKKLAVVSAFTIGLAINAQNNISEDLENAVTDSTESSINFNESPIVENLDSLLNNYYVQNFCVLPEKKDEGIVVPENFDNVPDSVIIARLAALNSPIELPYNDKVRAFIKMYLGRAKDQVSAMLGLQQYYFPFFEEKLDKNNMPLELRYVPVIESALNPEAVSRAGAVGLWQFMYSTGRLYKLDINSYVDERRDPIKSTDAAIHFLQDLYDMYGDWLLVIAAYNCGPGNVNKAIRRNGGAKDYWKIYYSLPRETRGYVPAFIAANYVMNYYHYHNIEASECEMPYATDTILVTNSVHFDQISEMLDLPKEMIKDLNPQYRRDFIPANSNYQPLRLPLQYTSRFIDLEDTIYAHKADVYNKNRSVASPASRYTSYDHVAPSDMAKLYYTVKPGDNLGYISEWYNVGLSKIRYWNNIYRNIIRVGQKLVIYVPENQVSNYKDINTLSFVEKQARIGKATLAANNQSASSSNLDDDYLYYTVKRGDNLWEIAKKYPSVTYNEIIELNNITNHRRLYPGQKLKIKRI